METIEKRDLLFGEKIADLRRENNLSQRDLAERLGFSVEYINGLENGEYVPSIIIIIALARVLHYYDAADLALKAAVENEYKSVELKYPQGFSDHDICNADNTERKIYFGNEGLYVTFSEYCDVHEEVFKKRLIKYSFDLERLRAVEIEKLGGIDYLLKQLKDITYDLESLKSAGLREYYESFLLSFMNFIEVHSKRLSPIIKISKNKIEIEEKPSEAENKQIHNFNTALDKLREKLSEEEMQMLDYEDLMFLS